MNGILELTPSGLYCSSGDFYIDPWQPVKRAVITHAHADHVNGLDDMRSLNTAMNRPIDAIADIKVLDKIRSRFDYAFQPEHNTQGVVVIRGGAVVAERYAEGKDMDSNGTSWSAGKSFASTLIGIAIKEGLIDSVDQMTRSRGLPLLYVIFYATNKIGRSDWREQLVKDELSRRGIPYIDTRLPLKAHVQEHNVSMKDLYAKDGHHNELGNQAIARAIIKFLNEKGYR